MKAVLDTNVLVSAILKAGSLPDRIVRAWLGDAFVLITSRALLAELTRVLTRDRIRRRIDWSDEEQQDFLRDVEERATTVAPSQRLDVVKADPADNAVLEAAIAGLADYIISGDRHLLDLGEYEGIRIVTPSRFLAILTTDRTLEP